MKKVTTLLFAVGSFVTSFAQTSSHKPGRSDQYVTNAEYRKLDTHRDDVYTFTSKQRAIYIDKINRDYYFKITAIKNNKHIAKREKTQMIRRAGTERDQKIQAVNAKFNSKFNSAYNDQQKELRHYRH